MTTEPLLGPPDAAESAFVAAGIASACTPPGGGRTRLQDLLLRAIALAMTGFEFDPDTAPRVTAEEFSEGLAHRTDIFRTRVMQLAILATLVDHPVSAEVVRNVCHYCSVMGVQDDLLGLAAEFAEGSKGLALIDFNRSGYTGESLSPETQKAVHTSENLASAWGMDCDDPALAARWRSLQGCPEGSLGLGVWRFYTARGFRWPGTPGSAPPYLAQHDWVHVLADYGSTVESELEVFAFIGRATDDPRGFSLLAMVIGLFETGDVDRAAGLFEADPGHLSRNDGMATRLADALRRGALTNGDQPLMERDWFRDADRPISEVRAEIGVVPKAGSAVEAGSVGPFDALGMSPYQWNSGIALAAERRRPHETWGATPTA